MILHPDVTHTRIKNTFETLEFRFIETHGEGVYDYSDAVFRGMLFKIWIRCIKHNHEFEQRPSDHEAGYNCPLCGDEARQETYNERIRVCGIEFLKKAKLKFGDRCSYPLTYYSGVRDKVAIWYNVFDYMFYIKPNNFLRGYGSPKCGLLEQNKKQTIKPRMEFEPKSRLIHGDKYNYSEFDYLNNWTKSWLTCNDCDHRFLINPTDHLKGSGCTRCANYGFDESKPATLYYLRVETFNQIAWKIGITNLSVDSRFNNYELENITIIYTWDFNVGREARAKEKEILAKYKEFKYNGDNLLVDGNTELFSKDVLNLDNGDRK